MKIAKSLGYAAAFIALIIGLTAVIQLEQKSKIKCPCTADGAACPCEPNRFGCPCCEPAIPPDPCPQIKGGGKGCIMLPPQPSQP